jgi:AraC-like DNA-binding protein
MLSYDRLKELLMSYTSDWDAHEIHKLKYNLSSEDPLRISSARYTAAAPGFFDMHYELEAGIVVSGKAVRKYQGYETVVEPGQVWLSGVWEPHGFEILEAPCDMVVFMIYPEFLVKTDQPGFNWIDLFSLPPERRPQIRGDHLEDVLRLCGKLRTESGSPDGQYSNHRRLLWTKLLLLQLLLYLTEGREGLFPPHNSMETSQFINLQPCLQLIYSSKKLVSLEDAARACALSPSQFSKLFKKHMGLPFSKFALRYRIKEAARQLIETDEPIKYIAVKWGFTDASHFYNCFMDHYAVSPKEYRERHRN